MLLSAFGAAECLGSRKCRISISRRKREASDMKVQSFLWMACRQKFLTPNTASARAHLQRGGDVVAVLC